MYARVASFEGGDSKRMMELAEEGRESGSMSLPEGTRRYAVFNDEEGGRRLFITLFDTREAAEAAEAQFDAMGDEVPEDIRGKRTGVVLYEIVADGEA
jgi:hypothetical protein